MTGTGAWQFGRFAVVGGAATATQYFVLVLLVSVFGVRPVTASIAGYVISALLNYRLNYSFTFRSSQAHSVALPRFFVIAFAGLVMNGCVVWLLNDLLGAHYLLSQIVATVVVLFWNFYASRRWTF